MRAGLGGWAGVGIVLIGSYPTQNRAGRFRRLLHPGRNPKPESRSPAELGLVQIRVLEEDFSSHGRSNLWLFSDGERMTGKPSLEPVLFRVSPVFRAN